jgi:hypothetical protein
VSGQPMTGHCRLPGMQSAPQGGMLTAAQRIAQHNRAVWTPPHTHQHTHSPPALRCSSQGLEENKPVRLRSRPMALPSLLPCWLRCCGESSFRRWRARACRAVASSIASRQSSLRVRCPASIVDGALRERSGGRIALALPSCLVVVTIRGIQMSWGTPDARSSALRGRSTLRVGQEAGWAALSVWWWWQGAGGGGTRRRQADPDL